MKHVAASILLLASSYASAAPAQEAAAASPDPVFESYRAHIAAAEGSMRLGEFRAAREWLDGAPRALRGFEWKMYDAALNESLASVATGEPAITSIAASPTGALLACGRDNGEVELRTQGDAALPRTLGRHAGTVYSVRFDAQGERLVSTSQDATVKVWYVASGELLVDFKEHRFPVGGAAFSLDGNLVASCSYERPPGTVVGTVHVWSAHDGSLVRTLEGGRKPLVQLEFSPDGRQIAAASWDFCLFVWDIEGGEPRKLAVPDEGIYNAVDSVSWSPDGLLLACGSKDKTARIWRVADGELVATLRGHVDYVAGVAFSPDGALLATASDDATLRLWSTSDWSARGVLHGHSAAVTALAFARDGRSLVSTSSDRTLRTWDPHSTWYGGTRVEATHAAYAVRFSPDDRRLASCSFDGRVQIWDTATWEELASWQAHAADKSCHMLDWAPDGSWIATGSYESAAKIWDADTLELLASFEHPGGLYYLRASPDGRLLATTCGKQVFVWDVAARAKLCELDGHTKSLQSVAFAPDSKRLVSAARDGTAIIWDVATGARIVSIATESPDAAECRFTSDGTEVIVADRAGTTKIHRASDGALVRELRRGGHGNDHIDLSGDGARVASASDCVLLVDFAHGGVVARWRPHTDHPFNLDFDAAGLRLASCSTDRSIAVADVRPMRERLLERDAARARRTDAERWLAERIAAGAKPAQLARELRADGTGDDGLRSARRNALLSSSAALLAKQRAKGAGAEATPDPGFSKGG